MFTGWFKAYDFGLPTTKFTLISCEYTQVVWSPTHNYRHELFTLLSSPFGGHEIFNFHLGGLVEPPFNWDLIVGYPYKTAQRLLALWMGIIMAH